jgi:uncharacterized membrane protein (UPF0127 family)
LAAFLLVLPALAAPSFGQDVAAAPASEATPRTRNVKRLSVGLHELDAEVASTPAQRKQGLMGRAALGKDAGMLFDYQQPRRVCMWMKDTSVPLSVAFIDDAGLILGIEDMQPFALRSHCSDSLVRYALEVNKGWFSRKNISPGSRIKGLPGS